ALYGWSPPALLFRLVADPRQPVMGVDCRNALADERADSALVRHLDAVDLVGPPARRQTRDGVQLFVDASCLRGPLGGSCLGGLDTYDAAAGGHGGVVQVPLPDGVAVPAQGFDLVGD